MKRQQNNLFTIFLRLSTIYEIPDKRRETLVNISTLNIVYPNSNSYPCPENTIRPE